MKLGPKFFLGLFAGLVLTLLAARAVRAQDNSTDNPAVISEAETGTESSSTATQAQSPANLAQQSPSVKAQKMSECESMMGTHAHHHWMEGHQMGMMGGPMMEHPAMMRMIAQNPKLAGHMLEMRADMMRAMADVMTKYGKQMESGQWQSFQTSSSSDQDNSTDY